LTKRKQNTGFAYMAVFRKPSGFASKASGQGFCHFSEEMRLNRIAAENKEVTSQVSSQKM